MGKLKQIVENILDYIFPNRKRGDFIQVNFLTSKLTAMVEAVTVPVIVGPSGRQMDCGEIVLRVKFDTELSSLFNVGLEEITIKHYSGKKVFLHGYEFSGIVTELEPFQLANEKIMDADLTLKISGPMEKIVEGSFNYE